MSRDALASVDGFRVACSVTYEYLWGKRVCASCPDCNNGAFSTPCQNIFGSNASPEGGSLGRADAGYTSIEAQKSKASLHAHSQLFVQCLHQHTRLIDVLQQIKGGKKDLVSKYLLYKAHVCKQTYQDVSAAVTSQSVLYKRFSTSVRFEKTREILVRARKALTGHEKPNRAQKALTGHEKP